MLEKLCKCYASWFTRDVVVPSLKTNAHLIVVKNQLRFVVARDKFVACKLIVASIPCKERGLIWKLDEVILGQ